MSESASTSVRTRARPARVWLAAGLGGPPPPAGADRPALSDRTHIWVPTDAGSYQTRDGRHRASWAQLHARYDLIEVTVT